ncbi:CPCC family cysteine-rich protein [Granulicella arctica]|uniref:CPCC family cysteine-rich protein n=1 Tax=Granulicella arctica TaxID=940613 RepID=UPI0015C87992|nr:CPCC family cysteine-rich protein [Granulicella arctica]
MKIIRYDSRTGERIEYEDGNPPPILSCVCPCCNCKTLAKRGSFEICPVCFWEDDGQDNHDADEVHGGPNGALTLTEARQNFQNFGACEENMLPNVRPPYDDEKRTSC